MTTLFTLIISIICMYFIFLYFISMDNRSNIFAIMCLPLLSIIPSHITIPLLSNYYQLGIFIYIFYFIVFLWIIKHTVNGVKSIIQDYIKDSRVNNIILNLVIITSYFCLMYYISLVLNYTLSFYYI